MSIAEMSIAEIEKCVRSCIRKGNLEDKLVELHNEYPLRYGSNIIWKLDTGKNSEKKTGSELEKLGLSIDDLRRRSTISILFTEEQIWNEFRKSLESIDPKASDPSFLIRVCLILLNFYPCSDKSVTESDTHKILEETAESLSTEWELNKKEIEKENIQEPGLEGIPDFVIARTIVGPDPADSGDVLVDRGDPDQLPSRLFCSAKEIVIEFCKATLLRFFISLAKRTSVPYEIIYERVKSLGKDKCEVKELPVYVLLTFSITKELPCRQAERLRDLPRLIYNDIVLACWQNEESQKSELKKVGKIKPLWRFLGLIINEKCQENEKEANRVFLGVWRFLELKIQNKECQKNDKNPRGDFLGIGPRDRGKITNNSLIWKELGLHKERKQKDPKTGNDGQPQEKGTKRPLDKSGKSSILDEYRVLGTRSIVKLECSSPRCNGRLINSPPPKDYGIDRGEYRGGKVPRKVKSDRRFRIGANQIKSVEEWQLDFGSRTADSQNLSYADWKWICVDKDGRRVPQPCQNKNADDHYVLRKYAGYLYFPSLKNEYGYKKVVCVRCDQCEKKYLEKTGKKESRRQYCVAYVNVAPFTHSFCVDKNPPECQCCGEKIESKNRKQILCVPFCEKTSDFNTAAGLLEKFKCTKISLEYFLGRFYGSDQPAQNHKLENEAYFNDIAQKISKDLEFKEKLSQYSKELIQKLGDPKKFSVTKCSNKHRSMLIAWDFIHSVDIKKIAISQNLEDQFDAFWKKDDSLLPKKLRDHVKEGTRKLVKDYVTVLMSITRDFLYSIDIKKVDISQNLQEQFDAFWEEDYSRPEELRNSVYEVALKLVKDYVTAHKNKKES